MLMRPLYVSGKEPTDAEILERLGVGRPTLEKQRYALWHEEGIIVSDRCNMVTVKITPEYTLNIPAEFRRVLSAGQEVAISADAQGRLIITPVEQIRARLMETFGMWADRLDLPADGVEAVNELRRGQRLDEFEQTRHETD